MKPAAFRYHAPKTVDEAVALLAEFAADDGRVLAGGQSLVPTMAFRLARPAHLVDINGVEALNRIAVADGKLVIGACVRHSAFHKPVCEGPLGKLLTDVVHHIAHYPIRNRGTFCGSLAHADPASEWCLVSVATGAEITLQSARGTRVMPATDFYTGAMTNELAADELVVRADLWCAPCNLIRKPPAECAGPEPPECLRLVTVEEVHLQAARLLREVGGYGPVAAVAAAP